jgi:hypothetical protein
MISKHPSRFHAARCPCFGKCSASITRDTHGAMTCYPVNPGGMRKERTNSRPQSNPLCSRRWREMAAESCRATSPCRFRSAKSLRNSSQITGSENSPSPMRPPVTWLTGTAPSVDGAKSVVDVTRLVLVETGRASHLYHPPSRARGSGFVCNRLIYGRAERMGCLEHVLVIPAL